MLDLGLDLSLPLSAKTIAGRQVHCVDGNELMACFETGLDMDFIRAIVAEKPLRFVCLDRGIADDADRYNLTSLFRQTSPHTTIRVI